MPNKENATGGQPVADNIWGTNEQNEHSNARPVATVQPGEAVRA